MTVELERTHAQKSKNKTSQHSVPAIYIHVLADSMNVKKINIVNLRSQILNMNSWHYVASFPIADQFLLIVPGCLLISATERST